MTARPKLTPDQLAELTRRRHAGERLKVLAHAYGLSADYIPKLTGPIHEKLSVAMRRRCS